MPKMGSVQQQTNGNIKKTRYSKNSNLPLILHFSLFEKEKKNNHQSRKTGGDSCMSPSWNDIRKETLVKCFSQRYTNNINNNPQSHSTESNLLNNRCASNASSTSKSTSSSPALYPEQGTFNSEESNSPKRARFSLCFFLSP